ncbi:hypothetical protein CASFOL_019681 [Castilleja foliolosa]|uniref:Uncharacterized protein n=1 Tax=Castilleja foliolosa TaxID=1961234 RepID=A0ABD3D1E5_9LAMI
MVTLISRWDRQQRQLRVQRRGGRLFSLSWSRRKLLRFTRLLLSFLPFTSISVSVASTS